jgi:hypothetical protein
MGFNVACCMWKKFSDSFASTLWNFSVSAQTLCSLGIFVPLIRYLIYSEVFSYSTGRDRRNILTRDILPKLGALWELCGVVRPQCGVGSAPSDVPEVAP